MAAPSGNSGAGKANAKDRDDEDQGDSGGAGGGAPVVRRKSKVHKGEGLWLMSFSDMSLILMSFFVLQLAYSNPDKRKYDNLDAAIKEQQAKAPKSPAQRPEPVAQNLKTIQNTVQKLIVDRNLEQLVQVSYDVNGLAVEFLDQTLFAPGSASPNPAYAKTVNEVLRVLAAAPGKYRVIFEGHTDDVPIATARFHSNWELSSARAVSMLEAFRARGVAESRMFAAAYAHTRPKIPTSGLKGESLRHARAVNRRVVIRLE